MSHSELRRQSNVSSSDSSTAQNHPSRRTFSRASSVDSIFDDLSIQAQAIFAHLDEEHKGYLDAHILAAACERGFSDRQLGDLLCQLDRDGDGKVSVDDFKQCLKQIARRNSVIRTSIRHFPGGSAARREAMTTSSSTTSEEDASAQAAKGTAATQPRSMKLGTRERHREYLLNRLKRGISRQESIVGLPRQRSNSLPDLGSVGEFLESLSCQEHIYELHHLLSSENPSLTRMYEYVLLDFVQHMQLSKQNQKRLEKQIESERSDHRDDLIRLSEELDQQVQVAEETARLKERQLVLAENKAQLEAKTARIEQLIERIKQMEEHQEPPENGNSSMEWESRIEMLQADLTQLRQEKARMEDLLTSARSQLAQTKTELTALRQTFNEKSRELENHITAFVEVVKENSTLKRQLCLLQEVNRDLCDANDGLCSVLERNADGLDRAVTLKEANTACSLIYSNVAQMLAENHPGIDPVSLMKLRHTLGLDRSMSITSEGSDVFTSSGRTLVPRPTDLRRKRSVLKATAKRDNSSDRQSFDQLETRRDSLHEDSGLSSLRDAPDLESEVELYSPETHRLRQLEPEPIPAALVSKPNETVESSLGPASGARGDKPIASADKIKSQPSTGALDGGRVDEKMRIFRVMLAGDSAVGKTSLLLRLCDDVYTGKTVSTIGIDMKMRSITVDGRATMLQIWDTAGQERFRSISASFYRKADGILLVYDCTSEQSFLNIRGWMNTIQESAGREIPVAILANKTDMRDEYEGHAMRCVAHNTGRKFAQELGALFFETSAATGQNVYESAVELTRLLCAQEDYNLRRPQVKLSLQSTHSKSGGTCCRN